MHTTAFGSGCELHTDTSVQYKLLNGHEGLSSTQRNNSNKVNDLKACEDTSQQIRG